MATNRIMLSNTAYTDLGATPCTVLLEGSSKSISLVVQSGGVPAANTVGAPVTGNMGGAEIGYTGQNAYAKPLRRGDGSTYVIVIR